MQGENVGFVAGLRGGVEEDPEEIKGMVDLWYERMGRLIPRVKIK